MDIAGLTAVITGGASGLGEATARHLTALGAKCVLFDMNEQRGEMVAKELNGLFCKVDVSDEVSVREGFAKARASFGQERIMVNCAGIGPAKKTISRDKTTGAIIPHDLAFFSRTVAINLLGTFNTLAQSAAGMAALNPITPDGGRGVIVNTASVAAEDGQMGQAAYAASKGGVAALTLPVARDLARDGIRVMAILPGLFHTPLFDTVSLEFRASLEAQVPFPSRLGKPSEYAKLVQSILENDMLNGTNIRLDGAIRMAPK
jgi:NAD(P)-dependent dehydrogenase (short-subunit alcohol dehydrogenase family)